MSLEPERAWLASQQRSGVTDTPALRAVIDPDENVIDIVDGTGPLLSLSFVQAESLAEEIRSTLASWSR